MAATLAAARFAHYAAVCLLFGLSVFPFYAGREAGRHRPRTLLLCSLLALITGGVELLAMVGNMGETWAAAFDPAMLSAAVTDTVFGRVWLWRLALAALIVMLCLRDFAGRGTVLAIASGLLLASIALTGHAVMPGGVAGGVHQLADGVHLLAAGWWIGGLLALLLLVGTAAGPELASLLGRFSRIGYAAVALLILSGLVNSAVLVSPVAAIVTTDYGRVLLAKIGLFGAMGLLALSNRRITPAVAAGADPVRWRRRLLVQVRAEFGLALLVLVVVGVLGAMSPPVSD